MSYGNGYPPIFQMPGGLDLDTLIKWSAYLETQKKAGQPSSGGGGQKSDVKMFLKFWKELQKEKEKQDGEVKKKKEEEDKKKKEGPKPPSFSLFQVLLICGVFGLPVGAVQFALMNLALQTIKSIVIQ